MWVFNKDKKRQKREQVERGKDAFFKVLTSFLGGGIAVSFGYEFAKTFGRLSIIGGYIGGVAGFLRGAMHFDFYARRKVEDGSTNKFLKAFLQVSSKTPVKILSRWKIENDRYEDSLREHFKTIAKRIENEPDESKKKIYEKDHDSFQAIINITSPNKHLISAAVAGAVMASGFRNINMSIERIGAEYAIPLRILTLTIGTALAASQICMYAVKKGVMSATHSSAELFKKIDAKIKRTPIEYATRFFLGRNVKTLDKLAVSDALCHDIVQSNLDTPIRTIVERSQKETREDGAIAKILSISDGFEDASKGLKALPRLILTPDLRCDLTP